MGIGWVSGEGPQGVYQGVPAIGVVSRNMVVEGEPVAVSPSPGSLPVPGLPLVLPYSGSTLGGGYPIGGWPAGHGESRTAVHGDREPVLLYTLYSPCPPAGGPQDTVLS